ncbi:MAG: hypothetical protein LBR82_00300 [Desulfovibrio sp.]|jgi:hypothetical protein|nr:hypothetical protein [Desulfovibrio sp.]
MRGLPKHYNTIEDFLHVASLGAAEKEAAKDALRELKAARYIWKQTAELEDGEEGVTDETHRVIDTQNAEQEPVKAQMALVLDEYSAFTRMGWTEQTAAEFLAA